MKNFMVYANGVLVDSIEERDNYTAEDYRMDCDINGWQFAPCDEDAEIELVEVKDCMEENDMDKRTKILHSTEYARNLLRYGRRVDMHEYSAENHFHTLHEISYRGILYYVYMIDGNIIECWHVR